MVHSRLFNRIQSPSHCLSHLLPSEKHHLGLCPNKLCKSSFIPRCLFCFLWLLTVFSITVFTVLFYYNICVLSFVRIKRVQLPETYQSEPITRRSLITLRQSTFGKGKGHKGEGDKGGERARKKIVRMEKKRGSREEKGQGSIPGTFSPHPALTTSLVCICKAATVLLTYIAQTAEVERQKSYSLARIVRS